ncbi:MAG: ArnT family glycosyltransferase, partial [Phycisphaerae bacterium]
MHAWLKKRPDWPCLGLLALASAATLLPLVGGPPMGDHECLHAQVSRQMLQSGNWLIPHYGQAIYANKPPLKSWLTAALAGLLEPRSDAPVTAFTARLPSAVAGLLTVLLIWRLGSSMFGRRIGLIGGFVSASSVGLLFYAANATMEMLTTCLCTWAFAEFWWAIHASSRIRRRLHLAMFWLAMGLAALAKGPVPLAMVALPLAVWWFANRPLRLALAGHWNWRLAGATFSRQVLAGLTRLWLLPGLGVFVAVFGWWAWLMYRNQPGVIWIWKAQFLNRATSQFLHSKPGQYWYYLPLVFAFCLPWLLSVPEAVASPFLKRYRRWRVRLLYPWFWWAVGLAAISLGVAFKRPHYLLPTVGGMSLLLAVVLARLFDPALVVSRRRASLAVALIMSALAVAVVAASLWARINLPEAVVPVVLIGTFGLLGFGLAGLAYLLGRANASFGLIPVTALGVWLSGWLWLGPKLAPIDEPLALIERLAASRIDQRYQLYWVDRRPDARVVFYGHRPIRYLITPLQIESSLKGQPREISDLRFQAAKRAKELLASRQPLCLIMRASTWGMFKNVLRLDGQLVLQLDQFSSDPDKALVVVTNQLP